MIDLVHLRHQRIAQLLPLPGHVHHRPRAAPAKALVGKRHHRAADDPRHAVAQHLMQTVHHAEAIHAREHRIDDQDVRRTLPAAAQHRAAVRDDLHRAVLAVVQLPLQTLRHAPVAHGAEDIHLAQHIDCPPFALMPPSAGSPSRRSAPASTRCTCRSPVSSRSDRRASPRR